MPVIFSALGFTLGVVRNHVRSNGIRLLEINKHVAAPERVFSRVATCLGETQHATSLLLAYKYIKTP